MDASALRAGSQHVQAQAIVARIDSAVDKYRKDMR
jgi:hypothetical protein